MGVDDSGAAALLTSAVELALESAGAGALQVDPATGRVVAMSPSVPAMLGIDAGGGCGIDAALGILDTADRAALSRMLLRPRPGSRAGVPDHEPAPASGVASGVADAGDKARRGGPLGGPHELEARVAGEPHRWLSFLVGPAQAGPDGRELVPVAVRDVTARKRLEARLVEAEHRFANIADATPAMMWLVDEHGRLVFFSRAWTRFTGQEEADYIGDGWLNALHPDDRERAGGEYRRFAERRVPVSMEYRVRTIDGEHRWVVCQGMPRYDSNGVFRGYAGLDLDVHARRESERLVRESDRRFRRLADAMPQLVWTADAQGVPRYYNAARSRYAGITERPDGSWAWHDALQHDDVEQTGRAWAEALRSKKPYACEHRVRMRDGSVRWHLSRAVWVPADGDAASGGEGAWYGTATDIHDLKVVEERLQRSQARLDLAQETASIGTFEWNIARDEIVWAPQLERLYGLAPGGFGGTYEAWRALVHADDVEEAEARVQEGIDTGEFRAEWRVVRDGEIRWLEARARVEHDRHGKPTRMIGMNIDITDRKRAEDRIRMVMAELNHRVKNTLATVDSLAQQTAAAKPDPTEFAVAFGERLRAMGRAHGLLTRSNWEGAELRDVVEAELRSRVADESGLEIDGPRVHLMPDQALTLGMIVHELATNAAKHGCLSVRGAVVHIEWRREDDALRLLWKERGGPAIATPPRPGFGTSLLHDLVEYEFDGRTELVFEPDGLRCEMELRLDRKLAARRAAAQPEARADAPGGGSAPEPGGEQSGRGPGARVLVVEDNALVAQAAVATLRKAGFEPIGPASSVAEAESLISARPPDAATLDLQLSGETSAALAEKLLVQGVPVLMLTGYNRADLPDSLAEAEILSKPYAPEQLISCVTELVGRAAR